MGGHPKHGLVYSLFRLVVVDIETGRIAGYERYRAYAEANSTYKGFGVGGNAFTRSFSLRYRDPIRMRAAGLLTMKKSRYMDIRREIAAAESRVNESSL